MSVVQDASGRTYDAVQLAAPATVDGQKAAAGWYVISDEFGQRSLCSPEAFASLFQTPGGGPAAIPVPQLPADQLTWTALYASGGTPLNIGAGQSVTLTFTGAQALRQLVVDVEMSAAGSTLQVSVARQWAAGGFAFVMDSGVLNASGAQYLGDFGEGSKTGRLLGAGTLEVILANTAGINSIIYAQVMGR